MENCLLSGKRICAYTVKNKYGVIIFEIKEELTIAGQNRKLTCEECGTTVFLKAGDTKVPHFAHHADQARDCCLDHINESEEHKKGKFLLYQHMKELYPDAEIQVNYRFKSRRWADILVTFSDKELLVIEYQRREMKTIEWNERHEHYSSQGIKDIWILSSIEYGRDKDKRGDKVKFFEEFLIKRGNDDKISFFDTESKRFTLVRLMEYKDAEGIVKEKQTFSKIYDMDKVVITKEGRIECDFDNLFIEKYKSFSGQAHKKEEAARKEREQEQERLKKRRQEWYSRPTQPQNFTSSKLIKAMGEYIPDFVMVNETNQIISSNTVTKKSGYTSVHSEAISIETLRNQALQSKQRNPAGPWFDSKHDEKYGTCSLCGKFTKLWYYFDSEDNSCKCKKCD